VAKAAIIKDYSVGPEELEASGGDIFTRATYPGDGNPHRSIDEFRSRYRQR
jgi:hypothetical protein